MPALPSETFDELMTDRASATGLEALVRWLGAIEIGDLRKRQDAAERAFREIGITFNVYGETAEAERIIPFDIVPRVFTGPEWTMLTKGLEQRAFAINAFLRDVYGQRRILADGVVPAELVLRNPQFAGAIADIKPPAGIYSHVCGIDLVRTGPTDFFVL